MMRKLLLVNFLFALSVVFTHGSVVEAQISGPPVPVNKLPDLKISEIVFEAAPTKIRVGVLNQGGGASTSCHLALMSLAGDNPSLGTKQRVWTIEVPALEAGKSFSNTIDVSPLTQTNGGWKAVVDRSNVVKESNEANNEFGFGGSVTVPLPDLQITGAVLTDATAGEMSVEVSNTGIGPASASQLRLIVWEMGKFEQKEAKTVFVKVPGIDSMKKINVKIKAGVPIISTKYSLFIDIGKEVTEKNEDNNRFEGEAGKS